MGSTYSQFFPPKPLYSVNDIPDLTGKVVIVTGATSGIGKETAKALLSHNAKVYIAARNPEKTEAAIKDLLTETGKEAIALNLDLADLKSVKAAAEEFLSKEKELHILFNNGGVMTPQIDQVTAQGYDLHFGTNVLGHYYFTMLLLPVLLAGVATSGDNTARIVNTSSYGHELFTLDFNTFKDSPARKKLGTRNLYHQSKFGNVIFAQELARRYGDKGIVSTSLNPGNLSTDLTRNMSAVARKLVGLLLYPAPMGALTQLYAGTSKEGATFNGKYLIPWARLGTAIPAAQDPKYGTELWKWLEEQVKDL